MIALQAVAALAVGLPYPGGQSGAAFLAGPKAMDIPTLGFVRAESRDYWLVNSKGFVVKRFSADVKAVEVTDWMEGMSLPLGYVAPDPRATVVPLPKVGELRTWMDVVAMGMLFARAQGEPKAGAGRGLLVLFLSSYGPADHLYAERLNTIFSEAKVAGINTIALFSGKAESKAAIARYAALRNLEFPCALDVGNAYADAFRASRTPEAFLLDKELRVIYAGAIDDSTFGGETVRKYLAIAIADYANGRVINNAATRVFGTPIDR